MIDQLAQLITEAMKSIDDPPWPVIFANQNIPRPVKPYVSINVLTIEIPDHTINLPMDENDNVKTIGWRTATVELQMYNGIGSLDMIGKLALILQCDRMIEYQASIDCAIGRRLFLGYVPELLNASQYEGRGIYQFEFMYTEEYIEQLYDICKVEFAGRFVGGLAHPDANMNDPPPWPPEELICEHEVYCPDWVEPAP